MSQINVDHEILETLIDLSKLLDTGLDGESILILVRLIELGVHPETLSELITEIRKEINNYIHHNEN